MRRRSETRETQELAPPTPGFDVTRYNRTDDAVEGGFRFALGSAWDIAPEVSYASSHFELTPEERNNESLAYLLGIGYSRPRLFLRIVGGFREGRPYQGSIVSRVLDRSRLVLRFVFRDARAGGEGLRPETCGLQCRHHQSLLFLES